jgi:hypothetical protein
MKKTTVTVSAIREMVNEIFDNKNYGTPFAPPAEESPVVVDAGVDPSAVETDPGNPNFRPQDFRELSLAITQLVKVIPDESIGPFYKKVKQVADDLLVSRDGDEIDGKRPHNTSAMTAGDKMKNEQKKVEEAVRRAVRKILIEMNQGGDDQNGGDEEELGPTGPGTTVPPGDVPPSGGKARKGWGEKASSSYEKKELTPFKDIAAATDMSTAGAKQAVDKSWRKGRFIDHHYPTPEKKQAFMSDMVKRYIVLLNDSNELSAEDMALLRQHPDMVTELEGFEDFMREELEDMGYYSDIEFTPGGSPIPRDPGYEFDDAGTLKNPDPGGLSSDASDAFDAKEKRKAAKKLKTPKK